jgi:hypothetical protein
MVWAPRGQRVEIAWAPTLDDISVEQVESLVSSILG